MLLGKFQITVNYYRQSNVVCMLMLHSKCCINVPIGSRLNTWSENIWNIPNLLSAGKWWVLGFVCPGSYLTLTVEPVLPSVISAGDASHVLGGESPGAARGRVVGSCHGDFSRWPVFSKVPRTSTRKGRIEDGPTHYRFSPRSYTRRAYPLCLESSSLVPQT